MNLFAVRKHLDKVLHPVVATLAKLPIHANAWTGIGALIGLASAWRGVLRLLVGRLRALLVRGLVDHVDGYKARNFNAALHVRRGDGRRRDRWVLGVMYAGGCIEPAYDYPHALIVWASASPAR
jgi:hypothetical protein